MSRRVIALSMGDPAGIGPELALKAAADTRLTDLARLVIVGNADIMRRHAALLGLRFDLPVVQGPRPAPEGPGGPVLLDVPVQGIGEVQPGQASPAGGRCAMECVEAALKLVQGGLADALVTNPINKTAIGRAGYPWAGHTDFLKDRTGTGTVVMMLVGGGLRVGLVTHHIAVSEVSRQLDTGKILAALRIMHRDLGRYFGLARPRIAVAGLNPHASDGGRFGSEEERVIRPAIDRARDEHIDCDGPHPPDTLFVAATRERYDAVLAMYHDQGLIPLKMLAFGRAVNLTLGLPIVRTSVDHGTAYDIAGKNTASTSSLVEAIRLAVEIVERLKQ